MIFTWVGGSRGRVGWVEYAVTGGGMGFVMEKTVQIWAFINLTLDNSFKGSCRVV